MSVSQVSDELLGCLEWLRTQDGEVVRPEDIASMVKSKFAALRGILTLSDPDLYHRLRSLLRQIFAAKADITALRADQIKKGFLRTQLTNWMPSWPRPRPTPSWAPLNRLKA